MLSSNIDELIVGDRVAAIADISSRIIKIYGYGIYAGESLSADDGKIHGRVVTDDNRLFVVDEDCYCIKEDDLKQYIVDNNMRIEFVNN